MTRLPLPLGAEEIGVRSVRGYTPRSLREEAVTLRRSRFAPLTAGWLCVLAALALSILGVVAIATTEPEIATRQVAFLCLAIVVAGVAVVVPYSILEPVAYLLLAAVVGLLVFVLLPFVPESIVEPRYGARRWISLGFTDFQPSELAKLAYILALAAYLRRRRAYRTFLGLFVPFALTFVPLGLVLVEPDLGTALLFLPTLFAMLLGAGSRLRHLALIVCLGLASAPMAYPFLQPHQKSRVQALVAQLSGDESVKQDIGYQGLTAIMLVGAGGESGVGAEKGEQLIDANPLPFEYNDMIFAVLTLRWGLTGAITTWALYLLLCWGGLAVAARTSDPFGRLVAIGVVSVLFAQMTVNTGMTVGILPITGMTLPFVSAGGTSLVAAWLMVGLVLNVGLRHPRYLAREARGFDTFPGPETE